MHRPSAKIFKKMKDQKIELANINARLSEANRKLHIIDECDRVKFELLPISKKCSFRTSITNPDNKDLIEKIFNAPFNECIDVYNDLLEKRNILTHRYSHKLWVPQRRIYQHNKTLQELCDSLPIYLLHNTS